MQKYGFLTYDDKRQFLANEVHEVTQFIVHKIGTYSSYSGRHRAKLAIINFKFSTSRDTFVKVLLSCSLFDSMYYIKAVATQPTYS